MALNELIQYSKLALGYDENAPGNHTLSSYWQSWQDRKQNPATTEHGRLLQGTSVSGSQVRTLVNEEKPAGTHSVVWDGRDDSGSPVASGVYFYRLRTGSVTETRKMVLIK